MWNDGLSVNQVWHLRSLGNPCDEADRLAKIGDIEKMAGRRRDKARLSRLNQHKSTNLVGAYRTNLKRLAV